MISNAPLERLINLVMTLDGLPASAGHEMEMRCLMRKIDWVANEAEMLVQRLDAAPAAPAKLKDAA